MAEGRPAAAGCTPGCWLFLGTTGGGVVDWDDGVVARGGGRECRWLGAGVAAGSALVAGVGGAAGSVPRRAVVVGGGATCRILISLN